MVENIPNIEVDIPLVKTSFVIKILKGSVKKIVSLEKNGSFLVRIKI